MKRLIANIIVTGMVVFLIIAGIALFNSGYDKCDYLTCDAITDLVFLWTGAFLLAWSYKKGFRDDS